MSQIESILFVASKPLSLRALAKALQTTEDEVGLMIGELAAKYNVSTSGIHLIENGAEVQMATNSANHDAIEGFIKDEIAGELTKAQLETLTVIAYRSPVTRPELEQIRGVNCALILRNLMMRGLIDEDTNTEALSPVYRLSLEAMRYLGIASPAELPGYTELHAHEYIERAMQVNESVVSNET